MKLIVYRWLHSYYYNNCSLVCCCLAQGTGSRVDSCRVGLANFRHIVCDSPAITEHTACGSSELLVLCCARVPQSKLFFFTVSCITSISIDVKLVSWYSWICSVRLADYAPLVGKAACCLFSYLGLGGFQLFLQDCTALYAAGVPTAVPLGIRGFRYLRSWGVWKTEQSVGIRPLLLW